ncbi:hypothetical protein PHLGIDRAFT_106353 [Phlebiopsis gigantea 11061_1 CR5-6]|uniref:Uncharacterized protein n=1 Tax=Phlebiopsis gigantea (strain 11061_1 CR5-6) TaxID=745531 RepID=A0A0C3SAC9_PHLG1|nr:hypothetical protein PHLGIDRAFT_106353 [Phlebiopsis gigantea 11061_1 CR5-6]
MTDIRVGQPWTQDEDGLLRQAVAVHGPQDNWKKVAQCVPGRTNKACRKRWLHSLCPDVKKTAWTPDEDHKLIALHAKCGTKWSVIAKDIPGRTDDACSKRYREALDPSLKRDAWTREEDEFLLDLHAHEGPRWSQFGSQLGRASLDCRNRWRYLERERQKTANRSDMSFIGHYPILPSIPDLPEQGQLSQPAEPPWAPIPYLEQAYWEPSPSSYPSPSVIMQDSLPGDMSTHESLYLSPEYSPHYSPVQSHDFHDSHMYSIRARDPTPPHVPPFNPESSSLHAALSISAVSPSSSYLSTPVASQHRELHSSGTSTSREQGLLTPQPSISEPDPEPTLDVRHPEVRHKEDVSDLIPISLGCTNITVPVPFSDCSQGGLDATPDRDPASTRTSTESYPTPQASPTTEASPLNHTPETSVPQEQDPLRHYRSAAEKRKAAAVKPKVVRRKTREEGPPPRLSASLPVNPDVQAYACGFGSCWSEATEKSKSCFATSQELCDHWKAEHYDDGSCERPFRCGLGGCDKGWRSINGLQYHLQISKSHFQQAVSAKLRSEAADAVPDASDPKKKVFSCTRPDCPNQYKQLSGLRYHLKHGHSPELPTQLDSIPPALAKKVEQKIQGKVLA